MFGSLIAAAKADAANFTSRIIRVAIGVVVAMTGATILLVALLRTLYVAVAYHWGCGPLFGHLSVAGVALIVLIAGLIVALVRGKPQPSRLRAATQRSSAQVFDLARSAGVMLSMRKSKPAAEPRRVSLPMLSNAALGAVIVGMLLGRRF